MSGNSPSRFPVGHPRGKHAFRRNRKPGRTLQCSHMPIDPLDAWRAEFPIVETCTYLVSHSLGAMPRQTTRYLQEFADAWSTRGVRAWHEGWWEVGKVTGDLLAPILGVQRGTISMHQNVT